VIQEMLDWNKCVERIYYDEQRSISQRSGNSPIAFILAAQHSLEYIDIKRYVVALSLFHSYFLRFSNILYSDKLWSRHFNKINCKYPFVLTYICWSLDISLINKLCLVHITGKEKWDKYSSVVYCEHIHKILVFRSVEYLKIQGR
jgi:hypothetical protein